MQVLELAHAGALHRLVRYRAFLASVVEEFGVFDQMLLDALLFADLDPNALVV